MEPSCESLPYSDLTGNWPVPVDLDGNVIVLDGRRWRGVLRESEQGPILGLVPLTDAQSEKTADVQAAAS